MKILALDTTAKTATAAVLEDEKLLGIYTVNTENTHSETLLPMIKSLLSSLSLDVSSIDAFAVSIGPGSFTGVRIGVATVKGLSFGTGKKCIGVDTIDALYENLSGFPGIVCPVMNARRGQVYCGLFDGGEKIIPSSCMELDELIPIAEERAKRENKKVFFVGDGYELCLGKDIYGFMPTPELLIYQNAYSVGKIAYRKIMAGEYTKDTELEINYIRKPQAEREREEKMKNEAAK